MQAVLIKLFFVCELDLWGLWGSASCGPHMYRWDVLKLALVRLAKQLLRRNLNRGGMLVLHLIVKFVGSRPCLGHLVRAAFATLATLAAMMVCHAL